MFKFIRIAFLALKRVLTGQVLKRVDIETLGGAAKISLRLKRNRSSQDQYVVLAGLSSGSSQYFLFEIDEFDRFIEAAKGLRASAQFPLTASTQVTLGWWKSVSMVMTGDEVQRIDTETLGGYCTLSLRLKRHKGSGRDYVVLAGIAPGSYHYFGFDMDQFDRFIEAAKDIRAAVRSSSFDPSVSPRTQT